MTRAHALLAVALVFGLSLAFGSAVLELAAEHPTLFRVLGGLLLAAGYSSVFIMMFLCPGASRAWILSVSTCSVGAALIVFHGLASHHYTEICGVALGAILVAATRFDEQSYPAELLRRAFPLALALTGIVALIERI